MTRNNPPADLNPLRAALLRAGRAYRLGIPAIDLEVDVIVQAFRVLAGASPRDPQTLADELARDLADVGVSTALQAAAAAALATEVRHANARPGLPSQRRAG